jgi:hypothetical protein
MMAAACASSASGAVVTASQVITSFTLRFSTVPVRPRSRRRATAERRSANAGANTASRTSRSEIMPTSLSASLTTGRCRTPRLRIIAVAVAIGASGSIVGHPGHRVFHGCRHGVLPMAMISSRRRRRRRRASGPAGLAARELHHNAGLREPVELCGTSGRSGAVEPQQRRDGRALGLSDQLHAVTHSRRAA